jgi:hypothetical protein
LVQIALFDLRSAERRQARKVARNHRRTHPSLRWRLDFDPREYREWNRGGKQYFACGNRCGHSRESRYLAHLKVKHLRRTSWAADFI